MNTFPITFAFCSFLLIDVLVVAFICDGESWDAKWAYWSSHTLLYLLVIAFFLCDDQTRWLIITPILSTILKKALRPLLKP
jgi:uncharacterized membrane protein